MLYKRIKALFNPSGYHGWGRKKKYFEAWFFKIVNHHENYSFVISPGVAFDEKGNKQAFIQLLDGQNHISEFITFPFEEFSSSSKGFEIKIGENTFSKDRIILNLPDFKGVINFTKHIDWPKGKLFSSTMGPFAFVPKMESYHEVVSLSNELVGRINIKGDDVDFTNGRGYIEKDWGHSFPSSHVWMQCNHFSRKDVDLIGLVAKVKWWKISFVGFVAALRFNDEIILFTTYSRSKIHKTRINSKEVVVTLENRKYRLKMSVTRSRKNADMAAPVSGLMDDRFTESLVCKMNIKLFDKKSRELVLSDYGENVGLEVSGKIDEIIINPKK